ncbi:fibroblast growth factor receptor 4-like [Dendronephthya gigantea]|uniref:fibroblast growth factor receptor 4-like n=1 Tax=Dendronephthya gigantea TaxID=151771 RepID=UPI00106951D4|nr:fibroblast growth factor receptor 4-like [Dendronephthya gigantea]XP_028403294.1 fibroblast growth factor receptor 4-like [Dendronephthya gigantea]XP_028403295.1 fibroblast growth factor receptor 4-like [Dendronephthya gigantea]
MKSVVITLAIIVCCYLQTMRCSASAPPFFQSDVSNATVVLGESEVKLSCRVIADVNTQYWWTKGGKRITKRKRYRIKKFRYLRIKNVKNSDAGEYVCRAKNNGGEIQQTITLIVEDPAGNLTEDRKPFFTQPKKMTKKMIIIPAGNKFKITCSASGRPSPTVSWYKNGKQLKLMPDGSTAIKSNDFVLNFDSLRPKDDGEYTCFVSNKLGNVSASFDLTVKEIILAKPVLQKMKNKTAYEGDDVTLTCSAFSDALPHFQWIVKNPKKNNSIEVLNPGLEQDDYICEGEKERWHCVKLLLRNVSRKDERQYYCMAGDERGWSKETVWLKVLPRPVTTEATSVKVRNKRPYYNSEKTSGNSMTQVIAITVSVVVVAIAIGSVIAYLCIFKRGMFRQKARVIESYGAPPYPEKRRDVLSSTSSSMSNCSTNPLLAHHGMRYLKRQNSGLSHVSEMVLYCDAEWEVDRENLKLLEVIGEGAFGKVLKAEAFGLNRQNAGKNIVAVKTLKDDATEAELLDLVSEMEVMKTIGRHKNIINVIGCCTQNGPLLVVVEYAPYGNLREYLRERRPNRNGLTNPIEGEEKLILRDFVSFSYQIARGMEYLSTKKCIHRDLAARNILVGEDKVMKIADFGLARDIHKVDYYRKTTDGRLPVKWMALEALFDRVYTAQSDVWSFGVVVWEILTFGGTPYPSIPLEKLFELLQTGYRMEQPVNCPEDLYDLLRRCWNEEPYIRPTFTDLVQELDAMLSKMTNEEYVDMGQLISPMQPHPVTHQIASSPSDSDSSVFENEDQHQDEKQPLKTVDCNLLPIIQEVTC